MTLRYKSKEKIMKSLTLRNLSILGLVLILVIIYTGDLAYADHSLGNTCYTCHTLRSSGIIVGSRSISNTETFLGSGWPTPLAGPDGTTDYVEGGPFDCSFCHLAVDDIPDMFASGAAAASGPGSPTEESAHPVDVVVDQDNPAVEIACADCHGYQTNVGYNDISPLGLQAKDDTDGYPNHRSITDGYYLYAGVGGGASTDYPNDASNRSHLPVPYGYEQSEGGNPISDSNRFVDWSAALDRNNMLCFVCHDDGATDSYDYTLSGEIGSSQVETDYNEPGDQGITAGHVIRLNGANGSGITAGDKMPCFNCHDSHAVSDPGGNMKFIRNAATPNPYGTSTFSVDGYTGVAPNDDRIICAGCHDTGLSASVADINGIVKGVSAVDPFNGTAKAYHGIENTPIATSPTNCLSSFGGCHKSIHNPSVSGGGTDTSPCWGCHGKTDSEVAGDIPKVKNGEDGLWGRGGDFGLNTTDNFTAATGYISAHNVDFDETSGGYDGSIGGKNRGSCTVCHTINERANEVNYHGDGDPRNDFRDIDTTDNGNELPTSVEPVFISDATHEGYYYDPPWLMCLECHDDEGETTEEYYGVVGNGTVSGGIATLNLDELHSFDRVGASTVNDYYYAYGTGDVDTLEHDYKYTATPGDYPDKLAVPAFLDDDNASPVLRYNMQPYKGHYYQTTGASDGELWIVELSKTLTDPLLGTYNAIDRIIDCLDCHNGHGSTNVSLYRSPDVNYSSNHTNGIDNANGRDICLDCHDSNDTDVPDFPPQVELMSANYTGPYTGTVIPQTAVSRPMWTPPAKDRYLTPINGHSNPSVSCASFDPSDKSLFKCHNPHAPSCESCHDYPPEVIGGVDSP